MDVLARYTAYAGWILRLCCLTMLAIQAAYAGYVTWLVFLDILAGWLRCPTGYAEYAWWFCMLVILQRLVVYISLLTILVG
jgi:hypothetical protein